MSAEKGDVQVDQGDVERTAARLHSVHHDPGLNSDEDLLGKTISMLNTGG